jgi:hypothetical protein
MYLHSGQFGMLQYALQASEMHMLSLTSSMTT